jgi:branched-chain amino acid transport system permease protein
VSDTAVEPVTEPNTRSAATPAESRYVSPRTLKLVGAVALGLAVFVFPYLAPSSRVVDAANQILIASLGALALNVLIGVAGQFSMGSAAFMALGAFTAATVSTQVLQLPFLAALLLGALVGGIAAVLVGILALRIRGFYLALATIALHYIVLFGVEHYQEATVGIIGFLMPTATIFGIEFRGAFDWYPVLLVILILVALGVYNLLRSKTGRAFRAVKDRDIAAAILGVNVTRTKLTAFIITSMIIGFQGALYAYYVGVVTYEAFHLDVSVQFIAMIMIGGVGTVSGSILGAIFVIGLPFVVQAAAPNLPAWFPFIDQIETNLFAVQSIIYGLAIIVFILRFPRGMSYGLKRSGQWLERRFNRRPAHRPAPQPNGNGS